MSAAAVFAFRETGPQAAALARALALPCRPVSVRPFPDGESLVRITHAAPTSLLYRSLDDPNSKLIELFLAASALRANGAQRVILIAPYLAYMRQDAAFHPGEAVSQKEIGRLLAQHFDGLVCVDPHLHRVASLDEVVPGIKTAAVSAAGLISSKIDTSPGAVIVGPDVESRQWVEAIAAPLGLDVIIGTKCRTGDREVSISFADIGKAAGRHAVIVDDVVSSGRTLAAAASLLKTAGAVHIEVMVTHWIGGSDVLQMLRDAGVARIRATDTVPSAVSELPIANSIAAAVRANGWAGASE